MLVANSTKYKPLTTGRKSRSSWKQSSGWESTGYLGIINKVLKTLKTGNQGGSSSGNNSK